MAKGGYERRRVEEKRQQEKAARRRARRNRLVLTWIVAVLGAGLGTVVVVAVFTGNEKADLARPGTSPSSSPTPSPEASPRPSACTTPGPETLGKKTFASPPCTFIDASKRYTATMKTSLGTIKVDLLAKDAPNTVNNFVFLAQQRFYDGSIFHRVIPDFGGPQSDMVQGGDAANRNGTGDAGYKFDDENLIPLDKPGFLAMANSGPGSNGSQFFILDGTVSHLNPPGRCPGPQGCHSVFGRVIEGLDVVKKIADQPRDENDKPQEDVVLVEVTVQETP